MWRLLSVLVAAISPQISGNDRFTNTKTTIKLKLISCADTVYSKCKQHIQCQLSVTFCKAIVTLHEEPWLADELNPEQDMNAYISVQEIQDSGFYFR